MSSDQQRLKRSAGSALLWGVGFNLGRDVVQFGSMLFLVRLLSPEVYGQFALAQTIQLFLAVISIKTLAPFALQSRNPESFDWDLQFTAGAVANTLVFFLTLTIAAGFFFFGSENSRTVGVVLAFMAMVFPVEIVGTHYFTWLQAHHQWKPMRLLLFAGTVIGSLLAIISASLGAGVFALAVGNLCFTLPLIINYCIKRPFPLKFQPRRLTLYREGSAFALNRMASGALQTGSTVVEQSVISGIFGFSALGIYTRSIALAQITSGRTGPLVTQTLYPVLTRAEASSERFRRFAGILFQGVLWTSVPAAAFLGLEADRLVRLLYGDKWLAVIPLMAAAAALLAFRGLQLTMNQIMLANLQQKACLRLDWAAAISMLVVILSTAFLGPEIYLLALALHAALVLLGTTYFAMRGGAIEARHAVRTMASCLAAIFGAGAVTLYLPGLSLGEETVSAVLSVLAHGVIFGTVYTVILRLLAPREMATMVYALPLPVGLGKAACLFLNIPKRPT